MQWRQAGKTRFETIILIRSQILRGHRRLIHPHYLVQIWFDGRTIFLQSQENGADFVGNLFGQTRFQWRRFYSNFNRLHGG